LADFYDALVPLAARELSILGGSNEPALARLQFDDVAAADDCVEVKFRDPERPGCLFGWRWSWAEGPRPEELEFAASMLRVNLEEDLLSQSYGLPADCANAGVTWF
jgi:hypothetical protein